MRARLAASTIVHALASFLTQRAFEFIRTDVGVARLPVKLVGFVPGLLSEANGPTHQAIDDVSLMRTIPGMQVFCPADLEELRQALPAIVESRAPAYLRYTAAPTSVCSQMPTSTKRGPSASGRLRMCARFSAVITTTSSRCAASASSDCS